MRAASPYCQPPVVSVALILIACLASRDALSGAPPPPLRRQVGEIGMELLLERWGRGELRDNVVARAIIERRAAEGDLGEREEPMEAPAVPDQTPWTSSGSQALGPDVIVNDRSLSACLCSNGRPVSEEEASIAATGPYVLASWNDHRGACIGQSGARQSYGWSTDYGATFREGDLLRDPAINSSFRGDPTVAVNAKTGAWYISGLSGGVSVTRGHFEAGGFVIDLTRTFPPTPNDGYDKPWMAVDSTSGNVYLTWTAFTQDGTSLIRLQRLDPDLNPLGPHQ